MNSPHLSFALEHCIGCNTRFNSNNTRIFIVISRHEPVFTNDNFAACKLECIDAPIKRWLEEKYYISIWQGNAHVETEVVCE